MDDAKWYIKLSGHDWNFNKMMTNILHIISIKTLILN